MIYSDRRGYALFELTPKNEPALYELICEENEYLKRDDFTKSYVAALKEYATFFVIKDESKDEYVGYIMVSKTGTDKPELGIYLRSEYRKQGIATEFVPKVAEYYSSNHEVSYFVYRAKAFNLASQKLAEKLGAVKLEDEGDVLYNQLMKIISELPPESREKYLKDLENEYDAEKENVIKYKLVLPQ